MLKWQESKIQCQTVYKHADIYYNIDIQGKWLHSYKKKKNLFLGGGGIKS